MMLNYKMAIAFVLAGAVFAPAAIAKETYVDPAPTEKLDPRDPNYMRCRKILETGSLVKKQRICKTNAEWAKASEDAQKNADDLIGRNRTGNIGQ
jgi:hypothetical protein